MYSSVELSVFAGNIVGTFRHSVQMAGFCSNLCSAYIDIINFQHSQHHCLKIWFSFHHSYTDSFSYDLPIF